MATGPTIPCPHCNNIVALVHELSGQLVACPFCGGQFAMPALVYATATPVISTSGTIGSRSPKKTGVKPKTAVEIGCLIIAGFLAVLCSGWAFTRPNQPNHRHAAQAMPRRGDIIYLAAPGNPVMWLPINSKVQGELITLSGAEDVDGIKQLIFAELVLVVEANTKAKVIEPGFLTHRVRIAEGDHRGKEGIANMEDCFVEIQPTK